MMLPDEFIMTAGNPNQQYIAKQHGDHYRIWDYPTSDPKQYGVWSVKTVENSIRDGIWFMVFNTEEDEQILDVNSIL